jgi:DnaJ-class molecular chaperone
MSEFKPCKLCNGSGFRGRSRTVICPECGGGGARKERRRGYHLGQDTNRRKSISKELCPSGHLKTGVSIDDNGNLRPYCEVCHRKVVRNNNRKKKESLHI